MSTRNCLDDVVVPAEMLNQLQSIIAMFQGTQRTPSAPPDDLINPTSPLPDIVDPDPNHTDKPPIPLDLGNLGSANEDSGTAGSY
ncbi:hypothetical protein PtA15_4A641 [Puccinia triticina]|uniref:Uncharacterized protein n=1 Tax=Puccinia triticina TaxID=208348 RepID=A0ABY7CHP4_9BASI|nr:uncharacterized protein PtA15_4A641 [Puccinia triticina]WAQ84189.1 hypothetical protein PtA15_4A641 [Puccinia triticina]